jgi:hypothetical protein
MLLWVGQSEFQALSGVYDAFRVVVCLMKSLVIASTKKKKRKQYLAVVFYI